MFKRLARESAVYGLAGGANRFIAILLVPVYTRFFAPDQYGLLDILMTSMTIMILLAGMQIESGVGRSYYEAKAEEKEARLVGTGILLYLPSCLIWGAAVIAAYAFWLVRYPELSWSIAIAIAVSLLPNQVVGLSLYIFRLEHRQKRFALVSVGDVVTGATLSIAAVLNLKLGVAGVIWGLTVSKILWSVVSIVLLNRNLFSSFDFRYAREILHYGVPIVPSTLTKWGQNYANRFILVAFLNLTDVGVFSLAVKLASVILLVDTAFRMAWDPVSIEMMGKPGSEEKYARMLSVYLLGMFMLAALMSAFGTATVSIVAGKPYLAAGKFVGFLSMGLVWTGATQILALGNSITRRTYKNIAGFGAGAGLNILALLLTVKYLGLLAAGIAFLLGSLAAALVLLVTAQRSHRIPYNYSALSILVVESVVFAFWTYFSETSSVALHFPGGAVSANMILCVTFGLIGALQVRHELKAIPAA